jgi:putative transposase
MGHHGAPRLDGFGYRGGHLYAVTCCTFDRTQWFADPATVDDVRGHLLEFVVSWSFQVPAYCFMPDHVHLVLEGTSDSADLRHLIGRWKQRTGYQHARSFHSRLWQRGYYDRVLRDESSWLGLIAYIVENPVRARLVGSVDEYPFWGSTIWSRPQLLEAIQDHAPVRGW